MTGVQTCALPIYWCGTVGLKGMPLHLVGYGDEGEAEPEARPVEEAAP